MITMRPEGGFYHDGQIRDEGQQSAWRNTMTYAILQAHNTSGDEKKLKLRFDSLTAHDITYVGIIQTARASGMTEFPMPFVLTNCHNSLCAVGGTINEDDHKFALSAAKKYGGTYVPTNMAVIHSYNREMMAGCGRMILGSDSHTRYGALGTMAIGEGGGELAKQLLGQTYDVDYPEVVGIYLHGKPRHGVGPQDVATALITAVYDSGFVKNRVMEFIGPGIASLPVEYRNGIDVMTTETTCLSSIWETDEETRAYLRAHGREEDYFRLSPKEGAYYNRIVDVDLAKIEPMIALPFHPSKGVTIREFKQNPRKYLSELDAEIKQMYPNVQAPSLLEKLDDQGRFHVDQAIIAGCSGGTYDNIAIAANIMEGQSVGNGAFTFSVYPGSMPINAALMHTGATHKLISAGGILREAFCGPCFGAGDTPASGEFSIRHTTRNFPNREGSKPGEGQLSYVALMDARSIAATAANQGVLTGGDEIEFEESFPAYHFDRGIYEKRVYVADKAQPETRLIMGPNIKDWPEIPALSEHMLYKVVSALYDPVTTTDELIPSGETSSYRSNPLRLAEFALSRRDPAYVGKAKAVEKDRLAMLEGQVPEEIAQMLKQLGAPECQVGYASAIYAIRPGDGSAREQAASSQRVLGGGANFAREYATKRYRSNLINWGMMPFLTEEKLEEGDYVFVPNLRQHIASGAKGDIQAQVIGSKPRSIKVALGGLTNDERQILLEGCLINFNRA